MPLMLSRSAKDEFVGDVAFSGSVSVLCDNELFDACSIVTKMFITAGSFARVIRLID